ncbi:MAG: M56 family metallopeptidase [bacterium]
MSPYRQEAARALGFAVIVSAAMFVISVIAILASRGALQTVALRFASACARLWAAVPYALQVVLGIVVIGGILAAGAGVYVVGKQWWATRTRMRVLSAVAVVPPPSLQPLLGRYDLVDCVDLIETSSPLALTAGFIRPRIVLSTGLVALLDATELEAVLLHERSHLQHRDPAYLLLARALAAAFVFVPIVGWFVSRYLAAVELAADDEAIAVQGDALHLLSAMVKVLRRGAASPAGAFTAAGDLRLSRLLDGAVRLPQASHGVIVQSAVVGVFLAAPAAVVFLLAADVSRLSFLLRCMV